MTAFHTRALERFSEPEDEEQLDELDTNLCKFVPVDCSAPEFRALLAVFERFPDNDGFGVFWSIVHLLEACTGYEPFLVESVLRKPCEFNLIMVNRLINAQIMAVEGRSLIALLQSAAANASASSGARQTAQDFWAYQKEQGRTNA